MREKIDLFLPCDDLLEAQKILLELQDSKVVLRIHFFVSAEFAARFQVPNGCTFVVVDR